MGQGEVVAESCFSGGVESRQRFHAAAESSFFFALIPIAGLAEFANAILLA